MAFHPQRFGAPRFDANSLRNFTLPTQNNFGQDNSRFQFNPEAIDGGEGAGGGFGFNLDTFNTIGSGIGGIGNLAKGFAAIKQLGLSRDALDFKKDAFNKNFAAQRTTINNRLRDQNAFKQASGRTDLAQLVL